MSRTESTATITIQLPLAQIRWLRDEATERMVSPSVVVSELIAEWMEHQAWLRTAEETVKAAREARTDG